MLNKSISLSSQVNKLNLKHKLIFTWTLPHLDDYGLIENDPEVLKATVCPMIKDITVKDFREFILSASKNDLIEEYEDCIDFTGFDNHQSLSEEKKAKSKFSRIPRNPQENIGENNNPQNFPVQGKVGEGKRSKEKIGEGEISTPEIETQSFFFMVAETNSEFDDFVLTLCESTGIQKDTARRELKKFVSYWTEPTRSGKKLKWELEKTFEVKRRLSKWFENAGKWSKPANDKKYNVGTA